LKCTALLAPMSLFALIAASSQAIATDTTTPSQVITPAGSKASFQGPAEFFTGQVRVDMLFDAKEGVPLSGAYVTFERGARSAWHVHPTGQHLVVTEGTGWTQEWGGPIIEIHKGDVVWCPPKIKHWHGATPNTSMTHLALTGTVNGKNVEWMEKVSDEQYRK